MSLKHFSERDICTKFIMPAITNAGCDLLTQVREEVSFTAGRIFVKGRLTTRGKAKRADYILYYKPNIPIAVIEAKDNNHSVRAGIQQALDYAKCLDIPFVFNSNGEGFLFHDCSTTELPEVELGMDSFPSPSELWNSISLIRMLLHLKHQKSLNKIIIFLIQTIDQDTINKLP